MSFTYSAVPAKGDFGLARTLRGPARLRGYGRLLEGSRRRRGRTAGRAAGRGRVRGSPRRPPRRGRRRHPQRPRGGRRQRRSRRPGVSPASRPGRPRREGRRARRARSARRRSTASKRSARRSRRRGRSTAPPTRASCRRSTSVPAVVSAASQLADARQQLERAKSLAARSLLSASDLDGGADALRHGDLRRTSRRSRPRAQLRADIEAQDVGAAARGARAARHGHPRAVRGLRRRAARLARAVRPARRRRSCASCGCTR